MKLYYSPGACSLSPHITLLEAGLPATLVKVDTKTHKLGNGADFYAVNAKGYVPVLELDDGQRLTEGPAIVQYLADRKPGVNLAPAAGTFERYRLQEWLNFITSELHKQYGPFFAPSTPVDYKTILREKLGGRLDWIAGQLDGNDYLMGKQFSVADAYLYTILRWSPFAGIDLARWPAIASYQARIEARPHVRAALLAEGLIKEPAKAAA
ncbi:MAG: glutathione transferase GstA [Casimicrobiaceae bacterium]